MQVIGKPMNQAWTKNQVQSWYKRMIRKEKQNSEDGSEMVKEITALRDESPVENMEPGPVNPSLPTMDEALVDRPMDVEVDPMDRAQDNPHQSPRASVPSVLKTGGVIPTASSKPVKAPNSTLTPPKAVSTSSVGLKQKYLHSLFRNTVLFGVIYFREEKV
jgi:hypothetical protein